MLRLRLVRSNKQMLGVHAVDAISEACSKYSEHVYGYTGVKWMRLKRCKCFRMMEHIATILPVSSGRMAVLGRVVSCEHWYQLSHEFIPIAALLLNSNVSFLAKFILFPDPLIVALNTWPCNAL